VRTESWCAVLPSVIVTGGSRDIGLAIVAALAGAGCDVIAVARRESEQLSAEIQRVRERGAVSFVPFDFANVDAIPDFVRRLKRDFGSPYGLVNNAALGTEGLLATMHNSRIEELLRINVLAPID
jgi:3-oxoacyl-[acyl-carrier protein] reductase